MLGLEQEYSLLLLSKNWLMTVIKGIFILPALRLTVLCYHYFGKICQS